jgi:hypothetical protein
MTFVPFFSTIIIPNLFITLSIVRCLAFFQFAWNEHMMKPLLILVGLINLQLTHTQCLLPCVVIVTITAWPNSCVFLCNTLTPCCIWGHDDPTYWFANGWGELYTTKVVVQLGFLLRAGSNTWWTIITPCGPGALGGGTSTWFGGHVDCISGNADCVCALSISATFVGRSICGNALDVTTNTLGGQPRFIDQLGLYGGQLPCIGQPLGQARGCWTFWAIVVWFVGVGPIPN